MKRLFTLSLILSIGILAQAQRYKDKLFPSVTLDSVQYGSAANWNGTPQDLMMNIFQPEDDTLQKRPLLVLAHGGAFVNGNRYAPDVEYLCREFAKRGYVCVSISYRLGIDISKFFLNPGPQFANAVWRGTLDGRAAIRYLRAHAATYKIDPDQFYLGGVSAGGVLGLHESFLDTYGELGAANPPIDTASIGGGIEGTSGTPGQSWRVKGVISLCGALGDATWMSNNREVAIFSVHGTADQTVPYKTDYFTAYNTKVAKLSGSFIVDSMAKVYGMKSFLYTFQGAPHVPFSPGVGTTESSTAYMDTTENLLRDFLVEDMNRKVGLSDVLKTTDIKVYPNPAKEQLYVQVNKGKNAIVEIMNLTGICLHRQELGSNETSINMDGFSAGIYLVVVSNEYGKATKKITVE